MNPVKINIKPLTVNQAWKGKRYKTKKYSIFEKECLLSLPNIKISNNYLSIILEYGFSNKLSDIDNPTKMILDILQKRYNFNDNKIYQLLIKKVIVPKGKEYFSFIIFDKEIEKTN